MAKIRTYTSREELKALRKASRMTARLLRKLGEMVRPGVSTQELEDYAERWIIAHKFRSGAKGYEGFPASICTSVNEVVCHGVPNDRKLRSGDVCSIDVCLEVEGWYGDACGTFAVGTPSEEVRRLIAAAEAATRIGISKVRAGNTTKDIGQAISASAKYHDCHVVQDFGGHGIGKSLHMDPFIPNFWASALGDPVKLVPGMCITIEPILVAGSKEIVLCENDQSYATWDGLMSAQIEHTCLVTLDGVDVLTR